MGWAFLNYSILEKEFDTYIKKTIKHTIINYAEKEMKKNTNEISLENFNHEQVTTTIDDEIFLDDIKELITDEKLLKIILQLSNKKRQILKYSAIDNLTSKEIAKITGKNDSTIRKILINIKNYIREEYLK